MDDQFPWNPMTLKSVCNPYAATPPTRDLRQVILKEGNPSLSYSVCCTQGAQINQMFQIIKNSFVQEERGYCCELTFQWHCFHMYIKEVKCIGPLYLYLST